MRFSHIILTRISYSRLFKNFISFLQVSSDDNYHNFTAMRGSNSKKEVKQNKQNKKHSDPFPKYCTKGIQT